MAKDPVKGLLIVTIREVYQCSTGPGAGNKLLTFFYLSKPQIDGS